MGIRLTKEWPYQLLFLIAVGFSYINIYELSLLIWLIIFAVTVKRFYSKTILRLCLFFLIIVFIGGFRAFLYDYKLYDILRDISYFIKPVVGLMIGYQCIRSKESDFFKTVIYSAFVIATIHYIILFFSALIHQINSIHDIRYYGGYFSDFETFALIILLFHKKFQLNFSRKKLLFLILFIGGSLVLYLARTNMIQFFILGCGMFGLFEISKRKIIAFCSLMLIFGIGYKIIYDMNPSRNGKGFEAFLYKIKNSPKEIYDPYVKNDNSPRFHDNFRSYETKITVNQVMNQDDLGVWLGKGFGSSVNYGSLMWTTDGSQVRHAPILHNGYTTIFLKSGIIGTVIFLICMIYLSNLYSKTQNPLLNNIKLLINSTGIFLFFSTLVFLGFYLKLDNKSLFVGGLIAYYEVIFKSKNLLNENFISK